MVGGETTDTSPFATFHWVEELVFITYPDDQMVLVGHDLGPAIDIGPAMTRKMALIPDKIADETMKGNCDTLTEKETPPLGMALNLMIS